MNNCYLGCGRQRGPLFKTEQCSFPSVATASDSLLPMKPGRKPGRKRKQTLCPHSWVQASESVCVAESQPSSRNVVRVRGVGLRTLHACSKYSDSFRPKWCHPFLHRVKPFIYNQRLALQLRTLLWNS
ncbi:uncharacterized protein ACWYII_043062 isoform 2-T3 [Salvelinus alpinus]